MLIPIPGADVEPGYHVTTPVRYGVKLRTQTTAPAKQAVKVRAQNYSPAKSSLRVIQSNLTFIRQSIIVGTAKYVPVKQGLTIRNGESFMLLADIYPATIPVIEPGVGGYYPSQYIRTRLTIGGVEIPVVDFNFERPTGRIGSTFNATVAIFDLDGLDLFAPVSFGYMIYDINTHTEHYVSRFENGMLRGRELEIAFAERGQNRGPNDTVQISAMDVIGDRFGRRPKLPITLYDPLKVTPSEVKFNADDALRLVAGALVRPINIHINGLSTFHALRQAYVTGLGFHSVVSNIPNYPISRADFTIEGGWHEGVLPLFAMYGPLFFDILNILFIINITWRLPAGFTPRSLPNSEYKRLSVITPVKEYTNSVILTYKADAAEALLEDGMFFTYRFDVDDPIEHGVYGEPGYIRTEHSAKVKEIRNHVDPFTIIAEEVEQEITRTYSQVSPGFDASGTLVLLPTVGGLVIEVHNETIDYIYNNGLLTNTHKVIEAGLTSFVDGSYNLMVVQEETTEVDWESTDDPNLMMQRATRTYVDSRVALSENTRTLTNPADGTTMEIKAGYPVLVAQYSGVSVDDPLGFGSSMHRVRTITETAERGKGDQVMMLVKDFDNITGTLRVSHTQPRTATPLTSLYRAKMRHILLEDIAPDEYARIPVGVNAGELPRKLAIALGYDVLRYIKSPRYEVRVDIAGIDLTLDKGSVVVPRKRTEDASYFIVTGISERGRPTKNGGLEITTSCMGQEVTTS